LQEDRVVPEWLSRSAIHIIRLSVSELKRKLPHGAVHQGIALETVSNAVHDISELKNAPECIAVAILDNVTDPNNLGAIVRSAAAFGVAGIILAEHSSCKITGTVAKIASGGLDHVNIYIVKNLANTIECLKTYGFWIVSLCETGKQYQHELDLRGKTCLILGSEGSGVRKIQKDHSDFIAKLPTVQSFQTLNVATAASIAFYELAKQNNFQLRSIT
jgi:23S rRNA (guanosine2251-2'-O)-methyltransferase